MISIDEMQAMLDELVEEIPEELLDELNGGIVLLDEAKLHEKSVGDDFFILGEYNAGGPLGRYITLYYGSFMQVYGHENRARIRRRLRNTLRHELRHHIESLAGVRDLDEEDAVFISRYLERKYAEQETDIDER
jgi:predicted Zn-dependent protease with MMP-like domain